MKVSKERLTQIVTEELKKVAPSTNEGDEPYDELSAFEFAERPEETRSFLDKDTETLKSRDPAEAEYQRGTDAVGQIGVLVERMLERFHNWPDPDASLIKQLQVISQICDLYIDGQEVPRLIDDLKDTW
jgi:hypothetical protein